MQYLLATYFASGLIVTVYVTLLAVRSVRLSRRLLELESIHGSRNDEAVPRKLIRAAS
jgi:hypothetical protein